MSAVRSYCRELLEETMMPTLLVVATFTATANANGTSPRIVSYESQLVPGHVSDAIIGACSSRAAGSLPPHAVISFSGRHKNAYHRLISSSTINLQQRDGVPSSKAVWTGPNSWTFSSFFSTLNLETSIHNQPPFSRIQGYLYTPVCL